MDKNEDVATYKEFINDMGGSGIIYLEEAKLILDKWKQADWIMVDEYIAPIVGELLIDAAETNRPLYEKLMSVIVEAHKELSDELKWHPEKTKLTRIK